ncbi:MAG: slipin family protein [Planctomycetota bacterium]
MIFYRRVNIRDHELGLLFRRGNFDRLLGAGVHTVWTHPFDWSRHFVEVIDTLNLRFEHRLLDVLLKHEEVRAQLEIVDLGETERALVWKDGRLESIIGPGRHAFWKAPYELNIERIEVDENPFEHLLLETILSHSDAAQFFTRVQVPNHQKVLLYRNHVFTKVLDIGRHVFWNGAGEVTVERVDTREQQVDIAGQEIMTRDKVTLRLNLSVTYRVTDPVLATSEVSDFSHTLYRDAQLAIRAAVGTRTLDDLLSDKESVGGEVESTLAKSSEAFGVEVRTCGLRDIILPGEMKSILNQVIEAEKQAQANLIRRREETAAARSQANTAKLLAENPVLARMKELEVVQDILSGAKTTFVFGEKGLTDQFRGLVSAETNGNGHDA